MQELVLKTCLLQRLLFDFLNLLKTHPQIYSGFVSSDYTSLNCKSFVTHCPNQKPSALLMARKDRVVNESLTKFINVLSK